MKDGGEQLTGDSDSGLLRTTTLLELLEFIANLGLFDGTWIAGSQGALNEQRLDILPGFPDTRGFLFSRALIVLWGKPGPGATMLGGLKDGHVRADFGDDTDCGHGIGYAGNRQ